MNTTPLPGGSTPVLASSRLRRITLIAGTVGLLWVVVISLLGVWRLDQLTTRHVSALQANAGRMADANTVVLGRSFDALRTVADMIAREISKLQAHALDEKLSAIKENSDINEDIIKEVD